MKVKEVKSEEQKSVQEVEQALVKKHDEEVAADSVKEVKEASDDAVIEKEVIAEKEVVEDIVPEVVVKEELKDEDVLAFMNTKYGREAKSMDEYNAQKESTQELPADVAAYAKYKKETGRGIEDYVKLSRDLGEANPDSLLKDYLTRTNKALDEDDIDFMMEDYKSDEYDDESEVRSKNLKYKKIIAEAKDFFETEKEKYRAPLESSGSSISEEDTKALEDYKQYVQQATTYDEEAKRKSEWFSQKTDEVFGSEFKGFEFTVDEDKKVTFSTGDTTEMKSMQENPQNFINKFLDDKGLLKDAVGYHKSLAVAMNPEKFAKFFYEQGQAEAKDAHLRETKNVNMSDRRVPEVTTKGGTQIRAINADSGKGLKIRSRNKN